MKDTGRFTVSVVAKGVSREKIFEWYSDFSPEDADILKKRKASAQLLTRTVTRDGNKLHIENEVKLPGMRKPRKLTWDAVLHPEDYTYDIHTSMPGIEEDRHYTFTQLPEGTRVSFESHYRATNRLMKFLGAIGISRMLAPRMTRGITKAFVAEAEEQLASKPGK